MNCNNKHDLPTPALNIGIPVSPMMMNLNIYANDISHDLYCIYYKSLLIPIYIIQSRHSHYYPSTTSIVPKFSNDFKVKALSETSKNKKNLMGFSSYGLDKGETRLESEYYGHMGNQ